MGNKESTWSGLSVDHTDCINGIHCLAVNSTGSDRQKVFQNTMGSSVTGQALRTR